MVANPPSITHGRPFAPPGPAGEPVRARPARALGAALGYLLVLAATAAAFLGTPAGQRLDGHLVPPMYWDGVYWDGADTGRTVLTQSALRLLYLVEDPRVLGALIACELLTGALTRRVGAAIAGIAALLCSAGGSLVLKAAVPRPDLGVAGSTAHNSFPSGHVAAATGLLLAFVLALPGRARWWFAAPGAVAAWAVGAATMIAGWHRLSDVLGGVALASASCCLAASALAYLRGGRARTAPARTVAPGAAPAGAAPPGTAPGSTAPTRMVAPGAGWVLPASLVAAAGTAAVSVAAAALPVGGAPALAAAAAGAFTVLCTAGTAAVLSVTRL
jgi:membrane-associated phospholipid phosphatase